MFPYSNTTFYQNGQLTLGCPAPWTSTETFNLPPSAIDNGLRSQLESTPYPESTITMESIRIALADGGRPVDDGSFTSRIVKLFLTIVGVNDDHYRKAEELAFAAKQTLHIDSIEQLLQSYDLTEKVNQLSEQLLKVYASTTINEDNPISLQRSDQGDETVIRLRMPIRMAYDDTDSSAELTIVHDLVKGRMRIHSQLTGLNEYFSINFRALAKMLDEKGICRLSEEPSINSNALSLNWEVADHDDLDKTLNAFSEMIQHAYTSEGNLVYGSSIRGLKMWQEEWEPSFVSALLDLEGINDSSLKVFSVMTCHHCFGRENCVDSIAVVKEIALHDTSGDAVNLAYYYLDWAADLDMLEEIVQHALTVKNPLIPIQHLIHMCRRLVKSGRDSSLVEDFVRDFILEISNICESEEDDFDDDAYYLLLCAYAGVLEALTKKESFADKALVKTFLDKMDYLYGEESGWFLKKELRAYLNFFPA